MKADGRLRQVGSCRLCRTDRAKARRKNIILTAQGTLYFPIKRPPERNFLKEGSLQLPFHRRSFPAPDFSYFFGTLTAGAAVSWPGLNNPLRNSLTLEGSHHSETLVGSLPSDLLAKVLKASAVARA